MKNPENKDLFIGYWPNALTMDTPGDRRRFVFYAKNRNIKFEIADYNKKYDVVYLTSGANLGAWIEYKHNNPDTKIIFELIDAYLLANKSIINKFRGAARFIRGKEKRFFLNYQDAFKEMISKSDVVVCSTPLQREQLLELNPNVFISLDYFSDDIQAEKQNYIRSDKLKLVWEGQAYTVKNLLQIAGQLQSIQQGIELHIITDKTIKYPFGLFDLDTKKQLAKLGVSFVFHEWQKDTFSHIIANCDLAIIPINPNDQLAWNKPENKLLLFWEIGIPVFTSPTPAYKHVMQAAGVENCLMEDLNWAKNIQLFSSLPENKRLEMVKLNNDYLNKHHTKEIILEKWDNVFDSIL